MASMPDMDLELKKLSPGMILTVKVRITRLLRFRMWVGSMLIRRAAFVMCVELVQQFEELYGGRN